MEIVSNVMICAKNVKILPQIVLFVMMIYCKDLIALNVLIGIFMMEKIVKNVYLIVQLVLMGNLVILVVDRILLNLTVIVK